MTVNSRNNILIYTSRDILSDTQERSASQLSGICVIMWGTMFAAISLSTVMSFFLLCICFIAFTGSNASCRRPVLKF